MRRSSSIRGRACRCGGRRTFEKSFLGPATLRVGLEKSRNLMTVRVAQAIGMKKVAETAQRLGVVDNLQPVLAMALGAGETTVLRLTNAYSIIDNGGKKVTASLVDRVQDKLGRTVFRTDNRACDGCSGLEWKDQAPPQIPDTREQVVDPASAYQMVSMMQGVVQRGTGAVVGQLGRPLAGKTGTTNDSNDVWFVGYSPDLAVGCYMGYDKPRTLGDMATGGAIIAPLFKSFIAEALKGQPNVPFRIPPASASCASTFRPASGPSRATARSSSKPSSPAPSPMATTTRSSWASASRAPALATPRPRQRIRAAGSTERPAPEPPRY